MEGFKKGITILVLAVLVGIPLLSLAEENPPPVVSNICGVIDVIAKVGRYLLFVLIALAVVFVIMAAFKYLTASGDAEAVKKANQQILYAVVAIVIGILASAVVPVVANIIIGADADTCHDLGRPVSPN